MKYIFLILLGFSLLGCSAQKEDKVKKEYKISKSDKEWLDFLGPERFNILRLKDTEPRYSGKYNKVYEKGIYTCAGCNQKLFDSNSKYDSKSGWPSYDSCFENSIDYIVDNSHGMNRTEIVCSSCGGHLGHVFNDGPSTTGKRYCVNSLSLEFEKK